MRNEVGQKKVKAMQSLRILGASLSLMLTLCQASAAEFELLRAPGNEHPMVFMKGPVESGDAARFLQVVEVLPKAGVILSGPGGSVQEALQIGAEIRIRGFTTMVLPDEMCASACGIIWLSGVRRYMAQSSMIGFHAAYITRDGVAQETGMGNAEIGSFMTHLGYGIEAIRFLTAAPPEGLNQLTPQRARALGIDVYENRGIEVVTPEQQPSISGLASEASRKSAAIQSCGIILNETEKAALSARVLQIFEEGHHFFGGEAFGVAVMNDRDNLALQVGNRGPKWCVENAIRLAVTQVGTNAASGPSFDCSLASTITERRVCADPELSRLDLLMADTYKLSLNNDQATDSRSAQRDWIRSRERCGDDQSCLLDSYHSRILDLLEGR